VELVEEGKKQHKLDGCPEQFVEGREGKRCMYIKEAALEVEKNHRRDPLRRTAAAHVTRGVRAAKTFVHEYKK